MSLPDSSPQAAEIEQALLGMLITYEHAQAVGCVILSASCFYSPAHRTIFLAIQQMQQDREAIDMLTIVHYLQAQGQLDEVGGLIYLADLCTRYATVPSYLRPYAKLLKDAARRRAQLDTATILSTQAGRMDLDAEEITRNAIQQLQDDEFTAADEHDPHPAGLAEKVFENYQAAERLAKSGREFAGLDTGFSHLSHFVNGLNRAEMTIIAARPSVGKTTLALQIAHHVARHEGIGVGIFSLEMSAPEVAGRITNMIAGIDPDRQRRGTLTEDDRERLYDAVSTYARLPIYVWQDREVSAIQARISQATQQYEIGLWIVDHLHRLHAPGEEYDRINTASYSMANLAVDIERPLLLLAQLNRSCEDRNDKRPQLSDLRGSGSIEEHAVNVWMIYRPGFYEELRQRHADGSVQQEELIRESYILVEKQRGGPVGTVPLTWIPEKALFGEYAPYWRGEHVPSGNLHIRALISERKDHD